MTYQEQWSDFKTRYGPRIVTFLLRVRDLLEAAGYTQLPLPSAYEGNDWGYSITVIPQHGEQLVVKFVVFESKGYDDPELGVNFGLFIEEVGGRIIDCWDPFLIHGEKWHPLSDRESVERRFALQEQVDPQEVLSIIEKYERTKINEHEDTT